MRLDGARTLAWRLRRHGLGTTAGGRRAGAASDVFDAVGRMLAVRSWPPESSDRAAGMRSAVPEPGAVARAITDGRLVSAYSFRGGAFVCTPEHAADILAVRTATRAWETARFQQQGGYELDDWELFRAAMRDLLADGPATRSEIGAHLAGTMGLEHLAASAEKGWGADALVKPLHWFRDICLGPKRDEQTTYQLATSMPSAPVGGALPDPELDAVGRRAVESYLGAYGPVTALNLDFWFVQGIGAPKRRLRGWLDDLGDAVTTVRVWDGAGGEVEAWVRTADLDEIRSAGPTDVVRLLPAFDPWTYGPGSKDTRVLPAQRRSLGTNGAPFVVRGGVVAGTWRLRDDRVSVTWFDDEPPAPTDEMAVEVGRLGRAAGKELVLVGARDQRTV